MPDQEVLDAGPRGPSPQPGRAGRKEEEKHHAAFKAQVLVHCSLLWRLSLGSADTRADSTSLQVG